MTDRQEYILKMVIDHFIETAEPVGSTFLVEQKGLEVSGATVRNEMRELEILGYLTHRHTSAGRIPTEMGYQYYVAHLMEESVIDENLKEVVQNILKTNQIDTHKNLAKIFSSWTGTAAIIGIGKTGFYYTGLANIFSQPEFQDSAATLNISRLFDQCEVSIPEMMEQLEEDIVHLFIGSQNPLGAFCGAVAMKINNDPWLLIGPMRMNYSKCIASIQYVKEMLK